MGLGQATQQFFQTIEKAPGLAQQSAVRSEQIQSSQAQRAIAGEENVRQRRQAALKTLGSLAPLYQQRINVEELRANPERGEELIDEFRAQDKILDDTLNELGMSQGTVAAFLTSRGTIGTKVKGIITDSNREQIKEKYARALGVAPESVTDDQLPTGGIFETLISSDAQGRPKPSVVISPPKGVDAKAAKVGFDKATTLRKEFLKTTKDFRGIRDSFTRVEESAKDPSAAGDLALIFNYMKILDPGSTVREGEFATAQNSGGVDDKTRSLMNSIINGKRLSGTQRKDFVNRAGRLFKARNKQFEKTEKEFAGLAKRSGLDPQNVTIDTSRVEEAPEIVNIKGEDFRIIRDASGKAIRRDRVK